MKPLVEVADIFRRFGPAYRAQYGAQLSMEQVRAMRAIEVCRTAVLGGHVEACTACGAVRIAYNSCRNRHCPKCQSLDKERWREARQQELLPVSYFHLVLTLPDLLGPLALRNQQVIYTLLFKAAADTVFELTGDPHYVGARVGMIAVLHTWSQTLTYHPHLHCIVTGGGVSKDGQRWITTRQDFFLPVRVVSQLFRGKFLAALHAAYNAGHLVFPGTVALWQTEPVFHKLLTDLYQKEWVVYCKPPFGNPHKVVDYLARYTHRVALSNDRLVSLEGDQVTFRYRDSTDHDRIKQMTLEAVEFIRRFLLHVLPDHFMKIRHYGLLSNRHRKTMVPRCQELLGVACMEVAEAAPRPSWQDLMRRLTGRDPRICPTCGQGTMVTREILVPVVDRAPP
jgi:hypothetical protein